MSTNAYDIHQKTLITLVGRLQFWVTEGELRAAPTGLYLDAGHRLTPDIFWVGVHNDHCNVYPDGDWHGSPDLIIEVLSPDSEADDRGINYNLYQNRTVYEYWLVNPFSQFIEVFVLMNKRYFRTGLYLSGEAFSSGVLNGQRFEVDDLLGKQA